MFYCHSIDFIVVFSFLNLFLVYSCTIFILNKINTLRVVTYHVLSTRPVNTACVHGLCKPGPMNTTTGNVYRP